MIFLFIDIIILCKISYRFSVFGAYMKKNTSIVLFMMIFVLTGFFKNDDNDKSKEVNVTFVFHIDDSERITFLVKIGDTITIPEPKETEGHQFTGWYRSNDYKLLFDLLDERLYQNSLTFDIYPRYIQDYTFIPIGEKKNYIVPISNAIVQLSMVDLS